MAHKYFISGARSRLKGASITESKKCLRRLDWEGREELERGWFSMDEHLAIINVISEHKENEHD